MRMELTKAVNSMRISMITDAIIKSKKAIESRSNSMSNEIIKAAMAESLANCELYPELIKNDDSVARFEKMPVNQIAAMGPAFEPVVQAFQQFIGSAGGDVTQICKVTIPKGTHLAYSAEKSAHIGAIVTDGIGITGQASINPLVCNPATICVAVALAGIDKKLDGIQEAQREILKTLDQDKRSELKGSLNFLNEVISNYKHNWNNDAYKSSTAATVQQIRLDAEQKIDNYKATINRKRKDRALVNTEADVKKKVNTLVKTFRDYELARYVHAFSFFVETLLHENYNAGYLDNIIRKIESYSYEYRDLFTTCYDEIEYKAGRAVEAQFFGAVVSTNKALSNAAKKTPLIGETPLKNVFGDAAHSAKKAKNHQIRKAVRSMRNNREDIVTPFISGLTTVKRVFNEDNVICFDKNNVYMLKG